MTTTPDAVDAMARAMSWMRPLSEDEMPDDALKSASEIMIMRLKDRGYTITSATSMSEFDLSLEAERLAYSAMVDADRMRGIIELAKKYRG